MLGGLGVSVGGLGVSVGGLGVLVEGFDVLVGSCVFVEGLGVFVRGAIDVFELMGGFRVRVAVAPTLVFVGVEVSVGMNVNVELGVNVDSGGVATISRKSISEEVTNLFSTQQSWKAPQRTRSHSG